MLALYDPPSPRFDHFLTAHALRFPPDLSLMVATSFLEPETKLPRGEVPTGGLFQPPPLPTGWVVTYRHTPSIPAYGRLVWRLLWVAGIVR